MSARFLNYKGFTLTGEAWHRGGVWCSPGPHAFVYCFLAITWLFGRSAALVGSCCWQVPWAAGAPGSQWVGMYKGCEIPCQMKWCLEGASTGLHGGGVESGELRLGFRMCEVLCSVSAFSPYLVCLGFKSLVPGSMGPGSGLFPFPAALHTAHILLMWPPALGPRLEDP